MHIFHANHLHDLIPLAGVQLMLSPGFSINDIRDFSRLMQKHALLY